MVLEISYAPFYQQIPFVEGSVFYKKHSKLL